MKKLLIVLVTLYTGMLGCRNDNNTSITVKDSHRYYFMEASYNEGLTHNVERYMNDSLGTIDSTFQLDGVADRNFTLGDHTSFHLTNEPGYISLKLDKGANSKASYHRLKSICNGIKQIVTLPIKIDH